MLSEKDLLTSCLVDVCKKPNHLSAALTRVFGGGDVRIRHVLTLADTQSPCRLYSRKPIYADGKKVSTEYIRGLATFQVEKELAEFLQEKAQLAPAESPGKEKAWEVRIGKLNGNTIAICKAVWA